MSFGTETGEFDGLATSKRRAIAASN